jgi:hypothetical protein
MTISAGGRRRLSLDCFCQRLILGIVGLLPGPIQVRKLWTGKLGELPGGQNSIHFVEICEFASDMQSESLPGVFRL